MVELRFLPAPDGVDNSAYDETFRLLNANIVVAPEFIRMGRSVSDIRFLTKEYPQLAVSDLDDWRRGRSRMLRDPDKGFFLGRVEDPIARDFCTPWLEVAVKQGLSY